MLKRTLSALLIIAATGTAVSVSAKSFDTKLQQQCRYILGDKDNGRYDSEAHGYSLGVIAGIKDAMPASHRNTLYKKSLGYLSNSVCYRALRDRSSDTFMHKYQRAALRLLGE